MTDIEALRSAYRKAKEDFDDTVSREFPGCNEWDWLRAVAHINGDNCRRNDDTSNDKAMAESQTIRAAWDNYMHHLHTFYRARDGEYGVLGGRGI